MYFSDGCRTVRLLRVGEIRDKRDLAGAESNMCGEVELPYIPPGVGGVTSAQGRSAQRGCGGLPAEHGNEFPEADGGG